MHYYQHSIGDYRRDTMHLSLLEHGVYRQLLDLYYLNECELNANALRLICARSAEEIQAAESVLNEFFERTENGYKHKRCDAEIERYQNKSKKAKASADARWSAKTDNKNANVMRTHSECNANHKPITNNHKPLTNIKTNTPRTNALDDGFAEFWNSYPTKTGKDKALSAWKKKKPNVDEVLNALVWQIESDKWRKGYIPNPATYINEGRWKDEPTNEGAPF